MSYFVVRRQAGPAWVQGRGAFDQPAVSEHAAFMNALAEEGVVVCAGPVAGSECDRIRVVLIAEADSEEDVRRHLAGDPWELAERVATSSIEPWNVIVGSDALAATRG